MSRRLRVEEEKARQLREAEDEEVEDKLQVQLQRIFSPLVWKRTGSGFRIEDVKEKYFTEILDIFQEHYIPNEVLCKNTELKDDEVSLECYLSRLLGYLKDNTSIMAVDESYVEPEPEEEDEDQKKKKKKKNEEVKAKIAGVLVLRVINKLDYGRVFSRTQLTKGDAMKTCVAFKSAINRKVDIYAVYNCDSILRYYDLCILPEYRKKNLGYQMMMCGMDVARAMGVPVVMGLFNNHRMQKLAKRLGFEVLYEINYVEWRDSEAELIFDDPGAGNYSCALMAGLVPPPPPRERPKPAEEAATASKAKVTRAEKQAAAAKKK